MDVTRYRKAKKEQKLTFEQLAEVSGVRLSTLKEIFRGATPTPPRIDTIQKIERALGLSDITDEEAAAGVRDYAVRNVTPDEDDLLEDFRELGKKKGADAQKAVRDMIHALLL